MFFHSIFNYNSFFIFLFYSTLLLTLSPLYFVLVKPNITSSLHTVNFKHHPTSLHLYEFSLCILPSHSLNPHAFSPVFHPPLSIYSVISSWILHLSSLCLFLIIPSSSQYLYMQPPWYSIYSCQSEICD